MPDQDVTTRIFPLAYKGLVINKDPAQLTEGQMQAALNVTSVQEGNITVRPGRRKLGTMPSGATNPLKIAKLPIPNSPVAIASTSGNAVTPIVINSAQPHGWQTGFGVTIRGVNGNTAANGNNWTITVTGASSFTIPATGNGAYVNGGEASLVTGDAAIRYVGEKDDIYRTLDDYASYTKVSPASGVSGSRNVFPDRWSVVNYSAGATGNPFAYFACPGMMLKDQGNAPYTPLQNWGISPGLGAVDMASPGTGVVPASFTTVSGAVADPAGTPQIQISDVGHPYLTGQTVTITGIVGTTEANGSHIVTVTGANTFLLNNTTFANAYISGGQATISGPDSTQPGAVTYDYVYTYRNPATGNEGNPSAFMDASLAVSVQNGQVVFKIWGSPDAQIPSGTAGTMVVYRRGGSYSDGIFRQVGYATNNGVFASNTVVAISAVVFAGGSNTYTYTTTSGPVLYAGQSITIVGMADSGNNGTFTITGTGAGTFTVVDASGVTRSGQSGTGTGVNIVGQPKPFNFVDSTPDAGLLYANQAEFDNYPPVVSTLRFPVNATIVSGSPGLSPGWNVLTLSSGVAGILTVGSSMIIGSNATGLGGTGNQETCFVAALPAPATTGANTTCLVFLQLAHVAGEPVLVDAVVGQPCSLAVAAFDSVFVAGDANNPHVLYKSKTGRPEAFPIIDSSGNSSSINVGTPSNGIQNLCEFRSKIVCLNVSNVYEVDVFGGVMYGPTETPAQRGLLVRWAFCKGDNAVFYLAYDGIYAWTGSQSTRISIDIDAIFHPAAPAGQYPAMDMTANGLQYCTMEYYRNQIFFSYLDTNGVFWLLRYEVTYNRWCQDNYLAGTGGGNPLYFYFYNEPDTNALIFARTDSGGGVISQADQSSTTGPLKTTDEFTATTGDDGNPIPFSFQSGFFVPGEMIKVKLFLDLIIEYTAPALDQFNVKVFYDYSGTVDSIDQFIVAPTIGTRTFVTFPLQVSGTPGISSGKEAFSISILISGTATAFSTWHSMGIRFLDRDDVQQGITSDWMNLGTNNDKELYQLHLEHNTGGNPVTLHMDIRYGINGIFQANDVALFPVQSTEKTVVTLPIPETNFPGNLTICKNVRLRPEHTFTSVVSISAVVYTGGTRTNTYTYTLLLGPAPAAGQTILITGMADSGNNGTFVITAVVGSFTFSVFAPSGVSRSGQSGDGTTINTAFRIFYKPTFDKLDLPPDTALFTPWNDFGYPCDKIARNLVLNVDTGGAAASIKVQADGTDIQTFAVTTTYSDRSVILPFASDPFPTGPEPTGKTWRLVNTPGAVSASVISITSVTTIFSPFSVYTGTLTSGPTPMAGQTIVITGMSAGGDNGTFVIGSVGGGSLPAISISVSNPTGGTHGAQTGTGTAAGYGGKVQLYNWSIDYIKEPCSVDFWDSYEQAFGYDGYKLIKQIWLEYMSPVPITFTIFTDNGATFYVASLPAHINRDVERFYLPDAVVATLGTATVSGDAYSVAWTTGGTFPTSLRALSLGELVYEVAVVSSSTALTLAAPAPAGLAGWGTSVPNKSKIYRFQLASTTTAGFKFYYDASRIEWAPLGADQRGGYSQMKLSDLMKIPAEPSGIAGLLGQ